MTATALPRIEVYSTLTKKKAPLETVKPGHVGMYLCGPTVYKPSHIGHMVGPVIFDTVKRHLEYSGWNVTWVVNVTDVDDKIIAESATRGTTMVKLAEEIPSLGEVHLATTICGNDLVYYGIHALETAYAVLGPGAVSCLNVGRPGRNIVRVRFESGRDLVLMVGEPQYMSGGFRITLYTKSGRRSVEPDLTDLYLYLMQAFLDMVNEGRKFAVPLDEMVEVIAVLEAGKRSLAEGREITIAEVLQ